MNHHDYVTVVEHNPHEFMREFQNAVLDGYGVANTIQGYPLLQGILKSVRLSKQEDEDVKGNPEDFLDLEEVFVVEYCEVALLQKTQAAIQAGYRVNQDTVNLTTTPRSVTLDKVDEVVAVPGLPKQEDIATAEATAAPAPTKTRAKKGANKNA
ncbi:putative terminase small subunit [Pseudomonas phage vB_PseuGesM_254]|uniref:Terminase small subunit n=1 Tax=Pseudomonas phage vB_PseuGesM_254 TaxID=3092638 RepID=A0AAX4G707_9CAUD|nr:putative terminase small subunit [Pseudomonas phage PseuGes_254]